MGKGKASKTSAIIDAPPLTDLEHQHTRVLLAELRRMQARNAQELRLGYEYCHLCDLDHRVKGPSQANDMDGLARCTLRHEEHIACVIDDTYLRYYYALKAELATREHVPNKPEAKLLRQQKAKEQRAR